MHASDLLKNTPAIKFDEMKWIKKVHVNSIIVHAHTCTQLCIGIQWLQWVGIKESKRGNQFILTTVKCFGCGGHFNSPALRGVIVLWIWCHNFRRDLCKSPLPWKYPEVNNSPSICDSKMAATAYSPFNFLDGHAVTWLKCGYTATKHGWYCTKMCQCSGTPIRMDYCTWQD